MSDTFTPVLQDILDATCERFGDRRPSLVFIAPGASVAWDNCCENDGQLWIRVIRVHPTAGPRGGPFPSLDTVQACGIVQLALTVGLGAVRCAHTVTDGGEPPSGDDMTADSMNIFMDASDLLAAAMAGIPSVKRVRKLLVGAWTPAGPTGGCAGGEWELTLLIDNCAAVD
jgi:hypothetical protein